MPATTYMIDLNLKCCIISATCEATLKISAMEVMTAMVTSTRTVLQKTNNKTNRMTHHLIKSSEKNGKLQVRGLNSWGFPGRSNKLTDCYVASDDSAGSCGSSSDSDDSCDDDSTGSDDDDAEGADMAESATIAHTDQEDPNNGDIELDADDNGHGDEDDDDHDIPLDDEKVMQTQSVKKETSVQQTLQSFFARRPNA